MDWSQRQDLRRFPFAAEPYRSPFSTSLENFPHSAWGPGGRVRSPRLRGRKASDWAFA